MRAKEAVEIINREVELEVKIRAFAYCYVEELKARIRKRFPNVKVKTRMSNIETFRREMDEWSRAVKRFGKFEWLADDAGIKFYGYLLGKFILNKKEIL